ncbi:MAG: AEC family transporter [Methylovulum sp.]|uniref:AEC family transporter n=1 Tax=Methylovulum sp. TaxID=1916980 RepID=UPI002618C8FA|nr:AEC family transporter [Methylovulum sp.]MDD2724254.1 AEC family transporter [Methylovulum sp.]MDD5123013.1 AEC family transporter [Methylovulum sp.]
MNSTLIQMTLLMACGVVWRLCRPAGLTADQTRAVLSGVVYYLLMPAMILEVLWKTDLGIQSLQYTLLGWGSLSFAILCAWLIGRIFKLDKKHLGTLILASAFPNVTFLGLPILEQTFGSWIRPVVIEIDVFSATPYLFTVGLLIARHYGQEDKPKPLWTAFNEPPFWTAAIAITLNMNGVAAPEWLMAVLQKLAVAAAPLMIISLGMSLNWQAVSWRNMPYMFPLLSIKMLAMPLCAWFLARHLGLDAPHQAVAVMDLAMPSMLFGIVFCDRFRLDSALYAMAVTVTTLSSLLTLPFWHGLLVKQ